MKFSIQKRIISAETLGNTVVKSCNLVHITREHIHMQISSSLPNWKLLIIKANVKC